MVSINEIMHLPEIPRTEEVRTRPCYPYEVAVLTQDLGGGKVGRPFEAYIAGRLTTTDMKKYIPVERDEPTLIMATEIDLITKQLINPIEWVLSIFASYQTLRRFE